MIWLLLFFLMSGDIIYAQEPVQGPITDAIVERFQERFDKQNAEMKAFETRMERQFGDRIKELASQVVEARDERKTIIETFRSWNQERTGLLKQMGDFARGMFDMEQRFAPLKWIVDRASALIWAIIGLVIAFAVLIFILIAVVLRLYLWVRNTIVPKELRTP
jgi:hypothetical protein